MSKFLLTDNDVFDVISSHGMCFINVSSPIGLNAELWRVHFDMLLMRFIYINWHYFCDLNSELLVNSEFLLWLLLLMAYSWNSRSAVMIPCSYRQHITRSLTWRASVCCAIWQCWICPTTTSHPSTVCIVPRHVLYLQFLHWLICDLCSKDNYKHFCLISPFHDYIFQFCNMS